MGDGRWGLASRLHLSFIVPATCAISTSGEIFTLSHEKVQATKKGKTIRLTLFSVELRLGGRRQSNVC